MPPKRRRLSPEELEIHQLLSPDDSTSTISAPAPAQRGPVKILSNMRPDTQAPATATIADVRNIVNEMSTNIFSQLKDFMQSQDNETSSEYSDEDDEELASEHLSENEDDAPFFDVNVNEPLRSDVSGGAVQQPTLPGAARSVIPGGGDSNAAMSSAPELPTNPQVVAPDPSLPSLSSRAPQNWSPDLSTLAWVDNCLDTKEWTEADRAAIVVQHSPDPDLDHLFTAVPTPDSLVKAMESSVTKERDYLFSRAEADRLFYEGAKDLSCSSRLLVSVLSDMKDDEDKTVRNKLAKVFEGMASCMSQTSRGRRELGRRFVPFAIAPALFKMKPSHHCLFGKKSLEEAIAAAQQASAINEDLVIMPKRAKPQPFPGAGSGGSKPWAKNKKFGGNKTNQKDANFQKGQKGKGKQRRGSRGKRHPKTAAKE